MTRLLGPFHYTIQPNQTQRLASGETRVSSRLSNVEIYLVVPIQQPKQKKNLRFLEHRRDLFLKFSLLKILKING